MQNYFQISHPQMLNIYITFHITCVFRYTVKHMLQLAALLQNQQSCIHLTWPAVCLAHLTFHAMVLTVFYPPYLAHKQKWYHFLYQSVQMKTFPFSSPLHNFMFSQYWRWRLKCYTIRHLKDGGSKLIWKVSKCLQIDSITPQKTWISIALVYILCVQQN